MRICSLFLLSMFLFSISSQAQNSLWTEIDKTQLSHLDNTKSETLFPDQYKTFILDLDGMKAMLETAPMQFSDEAKSAKLDILLPTPDGTLNNFEVVESPCMMPGIAAKYSYMKTYKGYNSASRTTVRFSVTQKGLYAAFSGPGVHVYIDPYDAQQTKFYSVYNVADYMENADYTFHCGVSNSDVPLDPLGKYDFMDLMADDAKSGADGVGEDVEYIEYRLAMACTGEFAIGQGGTVSAALAAIVITVDRLNLFFEKELAIHLNLIDENDQLVHTVPNDDPYFGANEGGTLLQQNTEEVNNIVGAEAYDWGHIYTGSCTDVGGIASLGSVCGNNKAAGVTCHYYNNLEAIAIQVTAHEMGHQLNATHTWSNCSGNLTDTDNLTSSSAFEPGAGSTVMSYSGVCNGSAEIQNGADDYYHVSSLDQAYIFTRFAAGSECGDRSFPGNTTPDITIPYDDDFSIPIGTPFVLTCTTEDAENDDILYNWEQFDLGPNSLLGSPSGNAPAFRTFPPNESPSRTFPRIQTVISGTFDETEVLSTYSRAYTFKVIARDQNPDAAGVTWEQIEFTSNDNAGPFRVTHPENLTVEVGDFYELTWDVANTTNSPVNCDFVNIQLSVDGGFTYPYTLIDNIPNDGAHQVVIPDEVTTTARFRVNAIGNIFFNISEDNVTINPPSTAGFSIDAGPYYQQVCLPDPAIINLNTLSLLDFNDPIDLDIVAGLPMEAIVSYSANPVTPSESSSIEVDLNAVAADNQYEFTIQAVSGLDTSYRTVFVDIVSNDFTSLALVGPTNGTSGASTLPQFNWAEVTDAAYYEIEIATDPAFQNIVDSDYNVTTNEYVPNAVLQVNTLYYWRVKPGNICGKGDFTPIWGFHTESLACTNYPSTDVPVNIPVSGTPTIESFLSITDMGTINDLNVAKLKINHDWIKHVDASIVSPAGTEVKLFSDECFNTNDMNLGFDDESPSEMPCPPVSSTVHLPQESLSAFDGESAFGTWTLKVKVNDNAGNGGSIIDWDLDICTSFSPNGPYLITNEPMPVPAGQFRLVSQEFLEVQDDDTPPESLEYTIVSLPENGTLFYLETPMQVGAQFNQQFLNDGGVLYEHDGSATTMDNFSFTVIDYEGGWYGIDQFNIVIDEDAIVNLDDIFTNDDVTVFPNPAGQFVFLDFAKPLTSDVKVSIFNVQGQFLGAKQHIHSTERIQMNTRNLATGLYLLRIELGDQVLTKKLTIGR